MKQTGLYFGSFNPVHVGHLSLAKWLYANTSLDEIWFILSPQNPFKAAQQLLDNESRHQMLVAATKTLPYIQISTIEFTLPLPSYTINTLNALKKAHPENAFYLIMGADNVSTFNQWKDYEKILEMVKVWVYPREGFDAAKDIKAYANMTYLPDAPLFNVSSTAIRTMIAKGQDIAELVPAEVLRIIQDNQFYLQKED